MSFSEKIISIKIPRPNFLLILLSPTGIGGQKPSPLGEDFSRLAIWRIIEKAVIVSMT